MSVLTELQESEDSIIGWNIVEETTLTLKANFYDNRILVTIVYPLML